MGGEMKKYIEFCDYSTRALDQLNDFISENNHLKVSVVGYRVVRYEQMNNDRTYILAEVEE